MPRKARKKSKNGIYHIILRGINKQTIFEEEEDNVRFLQNQGDGSCGLTDLCVYDSINAEVNLYAEKSKREK